MRTALHCGYQMSFGFAPIQTWCITFGYETGGFWNKRTTLILRKNYDEGFQAAKPLVCNPDGDINANIELKKEIHRHISQTLFMNILSLLTPQPDFCLLIFLWHLISYSTESHIF